MKKNILAIAILTLSASVLSFGYYTQMAPDGSFVGGNPQMAPDGSFVGGNGPVTMCPDGTFVSGSCQMAPDGSFVGI